MAGPGDSFQDSEVLKRALMLGLQEIEFEPPLFIDTDYGIMQLEVEKEDKVIEGRVYKIPDYLRYMFGQMETRDGKYLTIERLNLIREPAQEAENIIRIEKIDYNPITHSANGIVMTTDYWGQILSMSYRRYYGNKFEFMKVGALAQATNISIARFFERERNPPFKATVDRAFQLNYLPEKDFLLEIFINNISKVSKKNYSESNTGVFIYKDRFNVTDKRSVFFTPGADTNTVTIKDGKVIIKGRTALWEAAFRLGRTERKPAKNLLLWPATPQNIEKDVRLLLTQFENNKYHVNADGDNVTVK